jgi:hypothetical protein
MMQSSPSTFLVLVATIAMLMSGCRDSDETSSPRYNFSSFSGTVWKTKLQIAVAKIERGSTKICLIPPDAFDTNNAHYRPILGCTVMSVLSVGSRIRIERLVKDNVDWGGVRVTASLIESPVERGAIYVEPELLEKNCYLYDKATSQSTNWGMSPDLFEKQ